MIIKPQENCRKFLEKYLQQLKHGLHVNKTLYGLTINTTKKIQWKR